MKPVVDYNQDELCVKSQIFFQQHIIESRNSKIIMQVRIILLCFSEHNYYPTIIRMFPPLMVSSTQRQRLKLVPLLECNYSWLEMCGRFWIYGKNKQVYAPDYPQRQCWGCIVMWLWFLRSINKKFRKYKISKLLYLSDVRFINRTKSKA